MIFILGKSPKHLESEITAEATRFDDMVQEDFADTFVNLTLKATFMLKWITSNHCLNTAKFLFKTDDDTFVNPQQLWASLGTIHILRKHKRLLAKIYYSPQSKVIISLRLVQNACRY